MAGAERISRLLGWGVLLASAVAVALAQPEPGVSAPGAPTGDLTGKLTDLYSKPLDGATVVVRNHVTGAEARTTTQKNGGYRFSGLEPGEYTLVAETPRLGRGEVEGIVVDAGHEARIQTALEFAPPDAGIALAALRAIPRPWIAAAPQPAPGAGWETQPLGELRLRGRRMVEIYGEMPATASPPLQVTLSPEMIARWTVPGRSRGTEPRAEASVLPERVAEARVTAALASPRVSAPAALARGNPEIAAAGRPAEGLRPPLAEAMAPDAREPDFAAAGARAIIAALRPLPRAVKPAAVAAGSAALATSASLTGEQLQALPVNGRRWESFVFDAPGALGAGDGDEQPAPRGSASGPAEVTVEGRSARSGFGGARWSRGSSLALGESAVRQVESASSNSEAGAPGIGRVNVETRRGSKGLHGQGFVFDRQNSWGARNPFTQWVKETAAANGLSVPAFTAFPYTPPDHEMTGGFGVGGQIRRTKLFWFAALDANLRNDPAVSTVKHPDMFFAQPTNDQMQVLAARLGLGSANPVGAGVAAYSKLLETLAGLLGPVARSSKQWTGFGRVDWEANERHRFTLEGTGAVMNAPGGGFTRVSQTYGSHSFGSSEASEVWLLGRWEAFVTPNLLLMTQGSAGRNLLASRAQTPSQFEQTLLAGNAWGQLPQIVVDSRYGFTIGNPARFGAGRYPDEHLYEANEALDWVRGSLLVRAGFQLSHNADATSLLRNRTGTYTYAHPEDFASDALAFAAFGLAGQLDPATQHNCDQTGKVWRDSAGQLRGRGPLPCYAHYTQTMGPSNWHVSTNEWAGYGAAQWQASKGLVLSAGLRWQRQQLPPPIAGVDNPDLPLTQKLPSLGNNWAPRLSLALGHGESAWPVVRLGYGMYFGRLGNAQLESDLTQTGSAKGDLRFFMRPTDNLLSGGAPPFPYVLNGEPLTMVKPGAVEFGPGFRNAEIHQALAAVEAKLPGRLLVTVSAMMSLARRLPISIDTNFDPAVNPRTITYSVVDATGKGPIKAPQIAVPFYASWPSALAPSGVGGRLNSGYQQVSEVFSRANSTYEAAMLRVSRQARRGLTFHARYTYAHAMDWNPNESAQLAGNDVLDPVDFSLEYGTSNLDVRHSASVMALWEAPWKLRSPLGRLANGWMLSGVGQLRSGMPYTMRTAGSLAKEFQTGSGAAIVGLGPGMNGSGGDTRIYGLGSDRHFYNIGRNTFRYPGTWKADLRLGRRFNLGAMRQLELLAESFNLFNHQNVTELETVGYSIEPGGPTGANPTLNYLTGLKANSTAFGQPLNVNATNSYRERQFQVGLRLRF